MDPEFWHNAWQQDKTGWRQQKVNSRLVRFWPELKLPPESVVLVPLCGDTPDMVWLWEQGHTVVGCDLSELALTGFLEQYGFSATVIDHEIPPTSQPLSSTARGADNPDRVREYSADRLRLLCGDFLAMDPHIIGSVDAFFDRAATVALPASMRSRYARQLASLNADSGGGNAGTGQRALSGLLISMEYDQQEMSGPPFSVPDTEIYNLYGSAFELGKLGSAAGPEILGNLKERGLTNLHESVFRLDGKIPE